MEGGHCYRIKFQHHVIRSNQERNVRVKLACYFFWSLGTIGLLYIFYLIWIGDTRIFLAEYQNPLIRYSLLITGIDLGLVCVLTPFLIIAGKISANYYAADEYTKARTTFILGSLSAPGWIFLSVAVYYSAASSKALFVLGGLLSFIYISSIVTLLKHKS